MSVATVDGRKWVVVTPLSLPGERIRARVYRHSRLYSHADLLEVLEPNHEWRDMSRVKCQYFGKCAGCQYQVRVQREAVESTLAHSHEDALIREAARIET